MAQPGKSRITSRGGNGGGRRSEGELKKKHLPGRNNLIFFYDVYLKGPCRRGGGRNDPENAPGKGTTNLSKTRSASISPKGKARRGLHAGQKESHAARRKKRESQTGRN